MGIIDKDGNITHAGCVVEVFTRVERIMSDVWDTVTRAWVYEPERGFVDVWISCTEFGGKHAEVDATPEIFELRRQDLERQEFERQERERQAAEDRARRVRLTPERGKRVRVVKGRKVPKGLEGVIFWLGNGFYGPKVGFKTDTGEAVFVAKANVAVLNDGTLEPVPELERKEEKPPREVLYQRIIKDTSKAWLLHIVGREVWMPKSKVTLKGGAAGGIAVVPDWLIRKIQ